MHTAIMRYSFKAERLEEAVSLWKDGVASKMGSQPGFIRVQFYSQPSGEAVAIGSWASKEDAEAFMKTGVFADILKTLSDCMLEPPRGGDYKLEYFEQV